MDFLRNDLQWSSGRTAVLSCARSFLEGGKMGSYIIGIGAGVLLFNVVYINMLMWERWGE